MSLLPRATAHEAGLFVALDLNGNGQVTRLEMRSAGEAALESAGCTAMPVTDFFWQADTEKNNLLSPGEVVAQLHRCRGEPAGPTSLQQPSPSPPLPPPPRQGGKKASDYRTCGECVSAGLGWSANKNMCGPGFSNRRCPAAASSPATAEAGSQGGGGSRRSTQEQAEAHQQLLLAQIEELQKQNAQLVRQRDDAQSAATAALDKVSHRQQQQAGLCSSYGNGAAVVTSEFGLWQPDQSDVSQFRQHITTFGWTPIWAASAKDNGQLDIKALKSVLLKLRKIHPASAGEKSNAGGFHSDGDLLGEGQGIDGDALRVPELKALRNTIYRHIHAMLRAMAESTKQVVRPPLLALSALLPAVTHYGSCRVPIVALSPLCSIGAHLHMDCFSYV